MAALADRLDAIHGLSSALDAAPADSEGDENPLETALFLYQEAMRLLGDGAQASNGNAEADIRACLKCCAEALAEVAEKVKKFAVVYLVDIGEVPDFNDMYELYDPCSVMFFYRNKHIMVDAGTGNNNKINWAITDKQEMIDIIETVYRGATKGRGLVVSPKDYSTKLKY